MEIIFLKTPEECQVDRMHVFMSLSLEELYQMIVKDPLNMVFVLTKDELVKYLEVYKMNKEQDVLGEKEALLKLIDGDDGEAQLGVLLSVNMSPEMCGKYFMEGFMLNGSTCLFFGDPEKDREAREEEVVSVVTNVVIADSHFSKYN